MARIFQGFESENTAYLVIRACGYPEANQRELESGQHAVWVDYTASMLG